MNVCIWESEACVYVLVNASSLSIFVLSFWQLQNMLFFFYFRGFVLWIVAKNINNNSLNIFIILSLSLRLERPLFGLFLLKVCLVNCVLVLFYILDKAFCDLVFSAMVLSFASRSSLFVFWADLFLHSVSLLRKFYWESKVQLTFVVSHLSMPRWNRG
jgi:hypothetical protein